MTASLLGAVSKGFSSKQVIDLLIKRFPQHANNIQNALAAGFTADQVISLLDNKRARKSGKSIESTTEHEDTTNADSQRRSNVNKGALAAGGVAAASIMAPTAINAASSAVSRALPQSLQKLAPQIPNAIASSMTGQGMTPGQPAQPQQNQVLNQSALSQQPPLNNPNAASIPEPSNIQQPEINNDKLNKLWQGFEKGREKGYDFESDAFLKIAKRMKSTGEIKSKEDLGRFLNLFEAKKNEGKDLPTALKEASSEYDNKKLSPSDSQGEQKVPDLGQMAKGMTDNLYNGLFESLQKGSNKFAGIEDPLLKRAKESFDKGLIKSPQDLRKFANGKLEEPANIEKNSIVSSPNGVGEVKEIRNGQALVEIDGKLHKVKEEDLEPPLYSDDEIADAYDNLMAKIPEKERSGFISWAGYDEDRNVLGFIPRSGKYEELHNITPEEAKSIKEGTGIARTTNENREGLWVEGEGTRGGVISQIIWDRKHKKDAEEKKQGKFDFNLPKPEKQDRGMKPQFDEMAYVRNLSRSREKKAKDEERERKKKEKDEAKKRKK